MNKSDLEYYRAQLIGKASYVRAASWLASGAIVCVMSIFVQPSTQKGVFFVGFVWLLAGCLTWQVATYKSKCPHERNSSSDSNEPDQPSWWYCHKCGLHTWTIGPKHHRPPRPPGQQDPMKEMGKP